MIIKLINTLEIIEMSFRLLNSEIGNDQRNGGNKNENYSYVFVSLTRR